MNSNYKYKIVFDKNKRKGVKLKRDSMYNTAWFDYDVNQERWNPNIYGRVGNSVDTWAVELDEIKFFIFDVKNRGTFLLEKIDLLNFYKEYPLHDKTVNNKKRKIFPATLWKKINI